MADPSSRLAALWHRLSPLPGGRRLFSWLLGRIVPYSGSTRPLVLELEPGRAVVRMRDRRAVRNHLGSIQALALANLGELASGLAMTLAQPPRTKSIVVRLEIDYLKKARGTITARGEAKPPARLDEERDVPATAELTDEEGDAVARLVVHWRLRPAASSPDRSATARTSSATSTSRSPDT